MQAADDDLSSKIKKSLDLTTLGTDVINNIAKLNDLATDLNKTFGQTRQRITDVVEEIGKATPELTKLGGNAEAAAKQIEDVFKEFGRTAKTEVIGNYKYALAHSEESSEIVICSNRITHTNKVSSD